MNTPTIIGRQTFDGLGRQLTVEVAGSTTLFKYINGQLPPDSNTLADGKTITFAYESVLNNQLLSVAADGETTTNITRHPKLGHPSAINAELGAQQFTFTPSGHPRNDDWVVDGQTHSTAWHYSFGGLLQGFVDAQGVAHRRQFDSAGRVRAAQVGTLKTSYTYDALSRPTTVHVADPDNQRTLTTSITYDTLGREHTRTFELRQTIEEGDPVVRTIIQTLGYCALDQITSRIWTDGQTQGEETFEYDSRDRLVRCTANASAAAQDPYGNRILEQVFTFNAFNGHQKVVTAYADTSTDEARFSYAKDNPTQPVKITHTHKSWPKEVTLTYDACGRVIGDNLGRTLGWNTQGRLTEVRTPSGTCKYRYDPSGRLTDRDVSGTLTRDFFSADQLTHKQSGNNGIQLIGDMDALFAVSKVTEGVRQTYLLGTDAQGSVRLEAGSDVRTRRYTAHGADTPNPEHLPFGYAGEQREPLTGWYIPGGNRPYDPVSMCFLAPDTDSPFGQGGINPYAWCAGDPINRVDPDGHSWVSYALAGVGLALGAVALIPGLQAALPAANALFTSGVGALTTAHVTALTVTTLDIVSLATGAASTLLEATGHDSAVTGVLGGVSLVTGLIGAGVGLKLSSLRRAGAQQRALDVERGWKGPQAQRLGQSTEFLKDSSGTVHVGLIDSFQGSGHAALLTHGDPMRALLMGPEGAVVRAADLARDFLAPQLKNLDTPGHSVVLLSCWGAKNGAALEIAKELGRPVQGFSHKTLVKGFANLQTARNVDNIPREAVPFLDRLRATGNPLKAWKTTTREARPTFFYPDGTTIAF